MAKLPPNQKITQIVTVHASATAPTAARLLVLTDAGSLYDLVIDYSSGVTTFEPIYVPASAQHQPSRLQ